ncbi:hypothetical protein L198_03653 [Cryptococcus wingfieldii CBS 7118]|uniref:Impact N-terminal domain-containing protein n=1 Tax=Cryptococcus wingfieldii CBS 7118 TaxID=1295528 RepID=A0A1E3JC28_9TREE|nr:hypothetical protein L198_03653 [Cryptococcus wingfieldii CBS 7118]ODN98409.1 hypothetical protein L198_03653 [Cryptococcus wingfieldii CBS 7118]
MSATKRAASPSDPDNPKRPRAETASLHSWLHPKAPPLLLSHSPPLHSSSSTFLAFSIAFVPPAHATSETTVAKEARRIVRELDVVSRVGALAMAAGEGAFEDGEGRAPGKARAREPDHRMWACRSLCLKDGKNGTEGEDAYQLIESFDDDGEKFGGERILKVLKEHHAVDVLSVCVRWYGGDMIGPIRFQHIATTVQTSLNSLNSLVHLRDLRQALTALDEEITLLRVAIAETSSSQAKADDETPAPLIKPKPNPNYDAIDDVAKLERLVVARERALAVLQKKQKASL